MTKTMRIWAAATVAITAMTMFASPSSAVRPEPVRSGTITGWGITWPARPTNNAMDCQGNDWDWNVLGLVYAPRGPIAVGNPECSAWLKSGCHPRLAGRNPAVTASIVDISNIADGTTPRDFDWRGLDGGNSGGGVMVQLWREDCAEILSSQWRSSYWTGWSQTSSRLARTTFSIPSKARWMTVTTNDTLGLDWTLR